MNITNFPRGILNLYHDIRIFTLQYDIYKLQYQKNPNFFLYRNMVTSVEDIIKVCGVNIFQKSANFSTSKKYLEIN